MGRLLFLVALGLAVPEERGKTKAQTEQPEVTVEPGADHTDARRPLAHDQGRLTSQSLGVRGPNDSLVGSRGLELGPSARFPSQKNIPVTLSLPQAT